jgi:hypothetical protein
MSQVSLGIDENTSLSYEGSASLYGHAIWPSPFLSAACHIGQLSEWQRKNEVINLASAEWLFREDFFHPVTRVRRGRLYQRSTSTNPAQWQIQRHPVFTSQSRLIAPIIGMHGPDARGYEPARLLTFISWTASERVLQSLSNAVLILGSGARAAAHSILDIERLATGEELLTIRARASIGVLPELMTSLVPAEHATLVFHQYEKAASAAFRESADSVIDRCREAATAALNAEKSRLDPDGLGKDLDKLATFFASEEFGKNGGRAVLSNAARIIARLHARAKSVERLNRGSLPVSEGDAECALALLGIIYRELGWVRP